jgi:hypothetical protein
MPTQALEPKKKAALIAGKLEHLKRLSKRRL